MNLKRKPKWLSMLLVLALILCAAPLAASAAQDSEDVIYDHALAFGSDVRGQFDTVETAMDGLPESLEYVGLLGDMVEELGGVNPQYNAGEVAYGPLHEKYDNILPRFLALVAGDHDTDVEDGVGILQCADGYESGEIYMGVNSDGSRAYFVYAIGYKDMLEGGPASADAAMLFKHWVTNIDPILPIIVICHAPIQALRGDNNGAAYWNEALNYAATGVEGITSTDSEAEVIRNVIFLTGHNVTADATEYVYRAGTQMPVQVDTSVDIGGYSETDYENAGVTINVTKATDAELGEVEAHSVTSNIYYTSVTAGYMGVNDTSTLLSFDLKEISLTKYSNGSPISLGTDGATGEALGTTLSFARIQESDEGGPVITHQPEDTIISYPDGATFTVEVEDPDNVESYQWYLADKEDTRFLLEGCTAQTNTLVIPSTQQQDQETWLYCVITDKDGQKTVSRKAYLEADNTDIVRPILYIGEYAIEPGESLDLSTVDLGDGTKLGSGVVTYDANATDITIENLDYDNTHTTAGLICAPNVGLSLVYYQPDQPEYNITFIGENRIYNGYADYDYNLGGIPFDIYFNGEVEQTPVVNLIGDGTLHIINGSYAIRVIGDLMIDIDVTVEQDRELYADGLAADNMLIAPGRKINLMVNGSAFTTKGNLFIDNAEITVDASLPHISMGTVTKKIINCGRALNIVSTKMDIRMVGNEDMCGDTGGNAVISAGEVFISQDSDVSLSMAFEGSGVFAYYAMGIDAYSLSIEDSKVSINADSDRCGDMLGIYAETDIEVTNSELAVNLRAEGSVSGAAAQGVFTITDSNVFLEVNNYGSYPGYQDIALSCSEFSVDMTDPAKAISLTSDEGMALAIDTQGEEKDDPIEYEEGYMATRITFSPSTTVTEPANVDANLSFAVVQRGDGTAAFFPVETFYDLNDTSAPALKVVIETKDGVSTETTEGETTAAPTEEEETTPVSTTEAATETPTEATSGADGEDSEKKSSGKGWIIPTVIGAGALAGIGVGGVIAAKKRKQK